MSLIVLTFTKLKIAQRYYLDIFHIKFYPNWSIKMEGMCKKLKYAPKSSTTVTELIFS